jgi:hypothetical protein
MFAREKSQELRQWRGRGIILGSIAISVGPLRSQDHREEASYASNATASTSEAIASPLRPVVFGCIPVHVCATFDERV